MLRGNSPAKIDDKGRLKIPNAFRAVIQEEHGREVFVTSLTGDSVRIYPMPVWQDIERKLAAAPSTHPARLKFLDRVNFYDMIDHIGGVSAPQTQLDVPSDCDRSLHRDWLIVRPRHAWDIGGETTTGRSGQAFKARLRAYLTDRFIRRTRT